MSRKYAITPKETDGLFEVKNILSGDIYDVDTKKLSCSCNKFKFTKQTTTGKKKPCHHIVLCRGIEVSK